MAQQEPHSDTTADKSKRRLRDWTPSRRGSTQHQMRRAGTYSRFVEAMKFFLPATAGCLLLLIVYTSLNSEGPGGLTLTDTTAPNSDLVMETPLMTGFDGKDRPYRIKAAEAIQNLDDPNLVDLVDVRGNLIVENTENPEISTDQMQVTADEGFLNSNKDKLDLKGNVVLVSEQDYTFRTERAFVDFSDSTITGNERITGESAMGNVEADGFDVWEGGNKIRFRGNVRTIIVPE